MPAQGKPAANIGWWKVVRDDSRALELRTRPSRIAGAAVAALVGLALVALAFALGVPRILEGNLGGWLALLVLGATGGIFVLLGWLAGQIESWRFDFAKGVIEYRNLFHPAQRFEVRTSALRKVHRGSEGGVSRDSEGEERAVLAHHVILEMEGLPEARIEVGGDGAAAAALRQRLSAAASRSFAGEGFASRPVRPRMLTIEERDGATRYAWRWLRPARALALLLLMIGLILATPALMLVYLVFAVLAGIEPPEWDALAVLAGVAGIFGYVAFHFGKPLTGRSELVFEAGRLHCRSRSWGRPFGEGTGVVERGSVRHVGLSARPAHQALVVRDAQGREIALPVPIATGHFGRQDIEWIEHQIRAWNDGAEPESGPGPIPPGKRVS